MRLLVFLLCFFLMVFHVSADTDTVVNDTLVVETVLRSTSEAGGIPYDSVTSKIIRLDDGVLDTYRQSGDYNYGFDPPPSSSLGNALLLWIRNKVANFLRNIISYDVFEIILYVLGIATVVILVMSMMKTGIFSFISGKKSENLSFSLVDEDIHVMDFPSLISQAIGRGEYRYAVRLHYLHILKILTDGGLILWKPEKTNKEYVADVSMTSLSEPFRLISRTFDYVWYGERSITEEEYKMIEQQCEQCKQLVRKRV